MALEVILRRYDAANDTKRVPLADLLVHPLGYRYSDNSSSSIMDGISKYNKVDYLLSFRMFGLEPKFI